MAWILIIAVFFTLSRPAPSYAICACGTVSCAAGCDAPTVACCAVALLTLVTTVIEYVQTVIQPLIVAAVGGATLAIKGHVDMLRISVENAATKKAEQNLFGAQKNAANQVMAASLTNPADNVCILQNMRNVSTQIQKYEQGVAANFHDGVVRLYFNNMSAERSRAAHLQRLCKNGQISPQTFGSSWWTRINAAGTPCFTDPNIPGAKYRNQELAFMSAGAIFDHRVLVPPDPVDMAVLNDPDNPANPKTPLAAWTGMSNLQRYFVSAVRFCENLVIPAMQQQPFHAEQASVPHNMQAIIQNFSALAKIKVVADACRRELAFRTAADAAGTPGMGQVNTDGALALTFMQKAGVDPLEYTPVSGGGSVAGTFISPALMEYGRFKSFCSHQDTYAAVNRGFGSDAAKAEAVQKCQQLSGLYDQLNDLRQASFMRVIGGVESAAREFTGGTATPGKRADFDDDRGGLHRKAGLRSGRSSNSKVTPMRLQDMMRREDALAAAP